MDMLPSPNAPPGPGAGAPPIGGLPPKPPTQVGSASVPSQNHGNQMAAHAAIKNAAEGLQQALIQLPMGSEEHTKLLKIVKDLATMTADSAPDPHAQMQSLVAQARQASQRGAPPGFNSMMPAMAPPPPPGGDAGGPSA